jgi:hypothetical protein
MALKFYGEKTDNIWSFGKAAGCLLYGKGQQGILNVSPWERLSPGGLRGLQIRRGALIVSQVGSTPIRSRQTC